MSKNSPPEDIKRRRQEQPQSKQAPEGQKSRTQTLATVAKFVGKAVGMFFAFLGVVSAYLSLVPKVPIYEGDNLKKGEPFSTRFVVANEGPMGINNVRTECVLRDVQWRGAGGGIHDVGTSFRSKLPHMDPGERATLPCYFPFAGLPVKAADVAITTSFRPDWTFWRITRATRFITVEDGEGELHWKPQPLISEKPDDSS